MKPTRPRALVRVFTLFVALALFAAACGDDDGGDDVTTDEPTEEPSEDPGEEPAEEPSEEPAEEPSEDPGEEPAELTASFRGVTEDTITVGVAMLDFDFLVSNNLSPAGWGDQQAVWEALIADLNDNGGINGRQVAAVYDFYSPVDGADADRSCTTLTQDQEVFAVLGGFVGPLAGTSDPCITGLNDTILIGGEMNDDELAQSTAPWYTPGPTVEAQTTDLIGLLLETGEATTDDTVFVMGGAAAEAEQDFVVSSLEEAGLSVAGTDIIDAADGDTFAQDAELEVIMERVSDVGATAIFIHGTPSASIRGIGAAGLNGEIKVWTNDSAGLNNLGATIEDKSIADGVLTSTGPTDTEIYDDPLYQTTCNHVVAAALPEADLRTPTDYAEDEENWFNPVRRYCRHLSLFVQIATAAGPELTQDSFREGANSLTDFALPGSAASLGPDKLYADDTVRLSSYDSTEGDGAAVPVTELIDLFP